MIIIIMYIYQYIYGDEISRVNYQDPCIHWCIYYNTIIVIMYRNQPRPFFFTYYYYYHNMYIYIYLHKVYIYNSIYFTDSFYKHMAIIIVIYYWTDCLGLDLRNRFGKLL